MAKPSGILLTMSILILSDIHSNFPALDAVLQEAKKLGRFTQIISLGDVMGYYCMPNECISKLRHLNAIHILGNHDSYILSNQTCPRSSVVNLLINKQKKLLSSDHRSWLKQCPTFYKKKNISCVHGGWNDPLEEYLETISLKWFSNQPEKFFFSGHTHVQFVHATDDFIYCNPGSVGQPRDGDSRAAFAMLDGNNVYLFRVEYDIDYLVSIMKHSGYESSFYENLYTGMRIGGGVSSPPTVF